MHNFKDTACITSQHTNQVFVKSEAVPPSYIGIKIIPRIMFIFMSVYVIIIQCLQLSEEELKVS